MPTIAFHRSKFSVSPNQRHLLMNNGAPFCWMGDHAGSILQHLQRGDIDTYLQTRAAQHFSVAQVAVLPGADALRHVNAYGLLPFQDGDLQRPVEGFFTHLDHIVLRANLLGMVVAVEVIDATVLAAGIQPEALTAYAQLLSKRYQGQAVFWILGSGDDPDRESLRPQWIALGQSFKEHSKHLVAYLGGCSDKASANWAHAHSCFDMVMYRSPTGYDPAAWCRIAQGYAQSPDKPVIDGWPVAEDELDPHGEEQGRLSANQIRRLAYASFFSGACGFTYRNHSVEVWHRDGATDTNARTPWKEALFDPAADELHFLRVLIESRPFQVRVPDQSLLQDDKSDPAHQALATRADDDDLGGDRGSYAFIYVPDGHSVRIDLSRLTGTMVVAAWYDPRSGRSRWLGQFPVRGTREFVAPSADDWVLVLDDAARNYPPVGLGTDRSMTN